VAKKNPASRKRITELQTKIAAQVRRAARPALTVNTHARTTKSRRETEAKIDRRRAQRRDWEQEN
jgi:hypothetical protein